MDGPIGSFQPTPRFVSEANMECRATTPATGRVSTHAPLRQRGELRRHGQSATHEPFQPTPRFVSEANARQLRLRDRQAVSTHAPLRQRGERRFLAQYLRADQFQPTPRFVSEANVSRRPPDGDRDVSTHAPLRQRGEQDVVPIMTPTSRGFNPRPASSARRTPRSPPIARRR